jgi:hypothetical protein
VASGHILEDSAEEVVEPLAGATLVDGHLEHLER